MSDNKKPANAKRITVTPADEPAAGDTTQPLVVSRPLLKAPELPGALDGSAEAAGEAVPNGTVILKSGGKPALKPLSPAVAPDKSDDTDDKAIESAASDAATKDDQHQPAEAKPTADTAVPEADKVEAAPADNPTEATAQAADGDKTDAEGEKEATQTEEQLNAEAEAKAKHDAAIQKLVDSKQYFLPINAVEKRRTKHFVILGVLLSILLLLAWGDIALDAGLIQVSGVKPVTHFFSN